MSEDFKKWVIGKHTTDIHAEDAWQACAAIKNAKIKEIEAEVERLKRGEFICQKCGIRKDSEHPTTQEF